MKGRTETRWVLAVGCVLAWGLAGPWVSGALSAPPGEIRTLSLGGKDRVLESSVPMDDSSDAAVAGSWFTPSFEYRVGILPFLAPHRGREWNLGFGRVLDPRAGSHSYLGAGVALDPGDEAGPYGSPAGPWDRLSLGGWVGGCLSCDFRGRASLDLELKWTPSSLGMYGEDAGDEGRIGATLRIPW